MALYPLKSAVTIQFYDATPDTASPPGPYTLTLTFYDSVPDLPDVFVDKPLRQINDRGNFSHFEYDDDRIELPEVEFTVTITDGDVTNNKYALEQWFNEHQTVDGTALTSTNDGNATTKIPSDLFTCGMKILFSSSDATKSFGRDYKYVYPLPGSVSVGKDGQFKFRVRLLDTYSEISSL